MSRLLTVALVVAVAAGSAQAGKFNKKLSVGDKTPVFSDLPGIDDKNHSLADCKKDVIVVAITCNHCPVAVAYEDRIVDFANKYGKKIGFIAINVNNIPQDKLDKMKIRAKEKGFTFPCVYDESQRIARQPAATG